MNKNTFSISILIIGLILVFLLFSIFGILYFYWGDSKAVQDSLSTTGSIFGAIGTLGAAAVAAYLFNDWKEQHNNTILAPEAIVIYRNLENDIMDISKHNAVIKRNIGVQIASSGGKDALETLGVIIEKVNQRLVELKYFSTVSKNNNIDKKIEDYFEKASKYYDDTLSIFQGPPNQLITKDLVDKTERFTDQIVSEIYALKKLLSDYIILK